MPKVRFKTGGGPSPGKRTELLKILCQQDIKVVKLLDTFDGYIAIKDTEICTNNVFEDSTRNALTASEFSPVLSPEKRAKMTLVLKGIDQEVLKESHQTIEAEIIKSAPFAQVDYVYIMEKPKFSKVRFRTMAMANRIKESGLRLFWSSIPARNIEYERNTNMTCYSYEHTKKTCPTKDRKICSECAQEGHLFRDCTNKTNPKCINCGENHRTYSGKCKTRKESRKKQRTRKTELALYLCCQKSSRCSCKGNKHQQTSPDLSK